MAEDSLVDFEAVVKSLEPYYNSLKNYEFSYLNPLFWAGLLLLFIVVSRFWELKKSFSYCLWIGIILLVTSKLEVVFANLFSLPGASADTTLIKFVSAFVVAMLSIFYIFVRQ
jgi:hypothetical protein